MPTVTELAVRVIERRISEWEHQIDVNLRCIGKAIVDDEDTPEVLIAGTRSGREIIAELQSLRSKIVNGIDT